MGRNLEVLASNRLTARSGNLFLEKKNIFFKNFEMIFCYQNCSDLLWEKNCSSDLEKLLKFEAEGREFAKFLRSLEQFIQTVKGQNNFC